jgi:hypothetical protein
MEFQVSDAEENYYFEAVLERMQTPATSSMSNGCGLVFANRFESCTKALKTDA